MHTAVAEILIDIEAELRALRLWEAEPPSPRALASTQPFCFDTLTLPQWLQFVFLPRMHALVAAGAPLPDACGIKPMAEEYFRDAQVPIRGLLLALDRVDRLLSVSRRPEPPA